MYRSIPDFVIFATPDFVIFATQVTSRAWTWRSCGAPSAASTVATRKAHPSQGYAAAALLQLNGRIVKIQLCKYASAKHPCNSC